MSSENCCVAALVALAVKSAVSEFYSIKLGRTTQRIRLTSCSGSISIGGLPQTATDSDVEEISRIVSLIANQKVPTYRYSDVPRAVAETLYGEQMYDEFGIPANITELNIVAIPGWIVNATTCSVACDTECIEKYHITKFTVNSEKHTVEIQFKPKNECTHAQEQSVEPRHVVDHASDMLELSQCLPPNLCELMEAQDSDVNPWEVNMDDVTNLDRLIDKFGSSRITKTIIDRIEKLTGAKAHHLLTRDLCFSHRDLNLLLDAYERGDQFYLYTGRGPSSAALHVGHLPVMRFTAWLQRIFNVPCVIQLTDDEKYLFKDGEADSPFDFQRLGYENAKDIIACGFDPEKTFIFSNLDYIKEMYPLILRIQKRVTFNQVRGVFGFNESSSIGKISFPACQAAPSFPAAFPRAFTSKKEPWCLVPQGIDQDPYFRMTRDVAPRIGYRKPAVVHTAFIPALAGTGTKMSGSVDSTAIYVTDSTEEINRKVTKYAFSGGQETLELQRKLGANLEADISYQYLRWFCEDDVLLEKIRVEYADGRMASSEVKQTLTTTLDKLCTEHRNTRSKVTDADLALFMTLEKPGMMME